MRIKTGNWVKTNCKSLLRISCSDMATKQVAAKVVDLVVVERVVLEADAVVQVPAAATDLVVQTHNPRDRAWKIVCREGPSTI